MRVLELANTCCSARHFTRALREETRTNTRLLELNHREQLLLEVQLIAAIFWVVIMTGPATQLFAARDAARER